MPIGTFMNGGTAIRLRGLMWLALSDTGNVLTRTPVSDTGGGVTETWSIGADIPCRVDPIGGGDESVVAGRISDQSTHLITMSPETSVGTSQRVAIDNRGTFEVTAVRSRTAEWARRVEAVQVL